MMKNTPIRSFLFEIKATKANNKDGHVIVPEEVSQTMVSESDSIFFSQPKESSSRRVRWDKISVRSYPTILGDHPETLKGPALTIDWEHCSELEYQVDAYEDLVTMEPKRRGDELRIGWLHRKRLLKGLGFNEQEFWACRRVAERTRQQRQQTIQAGKKYELLHVVQETILRKVGRTIHPKVVLQTKY
jgi:hypothetical protein